VKLKTPFTFAGYSFTGRGSLFDADNEMVIIGIDSEQGQEIARRVNAHDALVEACEAVEKWIRCNRGFPLEPDGNVLRDLFVARGLAEKCVESALALVRREADDA